MQFLSKKSAPKDREQCCLTFPKGGARAPPGYGPGFRQRLDESHFFGARNYFSGFSSMTDSRRGRTVAQLSAKLSTHHTISTITQLSGKISTRHLSTFDSHLLNTYTIQTPLFELFSGRPYGVPQPPTEKI